MAAVLLGIVFAGFFYGPLVLASAASVYWLVKGRRIMALALALLAIYIGSEMFAISYMDSWRQGVPMVVAAYESWIGLAIMVAIGGLGEFIVEKFGTD